MTRIDPSHGTTIRIRHDRIDLSLQDNPKIVYFAIKIKIIMRFSDFRILDSRISLNSYYLYRLSLYLQATQ